MYVRKNTGPRTVRLPDGRLLTLADLPPARTRWVASRKALVVEAVAHGLLARDEALRRYALSEEEFDGWSRAAARHGREALKITAIQRFRQPKGDRQETPSPVTRN